MKRIRPRRFQKMDLLYRIHDRLEERLRRERILAWAHPSSPCVAECERAVERLKTALKPYRP